MKTKKSKIKKFLIPLLIIIILATAFIMRLISNKKSFEAELDLVKDFVTTIPVITEKVSLKQIPDQFNTNGSFFAYKSVTVASETQGRVLSINADAGSSVNINQTLAQTDNEVLKSQMELSKANLDKAKKDLERFDKLSKDNAVSIQQYESANLAFSNANTAHLAAQKLFENSTVKSPISGVITKRHIEKGTYLNPGMPAFDIVEISKVKFIVKLTQDEVKKISVGKNVRVDAEAYPGIDYEGKVKSIIIQADPSKRYEVEIEVQNRTDKILKPGMFGNVSFSGEAKESLTISRKALTGSVKSPEVFLVQGDSVILQSIIIESLNEKYLNVKQGLKEGDAVVVSGQINLKNGTKIKVQ